MNDYEVRRDHRPEGEAMSTDERPKTVTTTFEVQTGGSGSGHFTGMHLVPEGYDGRSGVSTEPLGLLGRQLGPGSRVRVTVEVLDETPLDPIEHRSHEHTQHPSNQCLYCIEQNPDRFVVLRCGHGRLVSKWRVDGRPSQMQCWDAWCPSTDGWQDVIHVPGVPDATLAIDRVRAAAAAQGVPVREF
jgi:hypothetical protein